jgi:uncharacterized protein (TIGR03435 family)
MRLVAMNFAVLALAAGLAPSQTAVPAKFEVASIRPCDATPLQAPPDGGRGNPKSGGKGGGGFSPGRLALHCVTVKSLIVRAYDIYANGRRLPVLPPNFRTDPVAGGDPWVDSARYEILAKAEGNPAMEMMNGPMLQVLLEDRFKLKLHRETREVPVYVLTVAKSGLKLPRVNEGSCTPLDMDNVHASVEPGEKRPDFCGAGGIGRKGSDGMVETRANTIVNFARMLGSVLDRPIVDKTGISGLFNFHLEFAPDLSTPRFSAPRVDDPAVGPSIFTAIQEQLGLKLEAAKGPGEFIVIDHVEKPSEN